MFGNGFKLDMLVKTIKKEKPKQISIGTHHYVQLAETNILDDMDPKDLDSIQLVVPTGAAVPLAIQKRLKKKMRNLKVFYELSYVFTPPKH